MDAQFGIDDVSTIKTTLIDFSEPTFVDAVSYAFDSVARTMVARFQCEHYGECVVTRQLAPHETQTSNEDLQIIARIANQKLERITTESGFGAVFMADIEFSDIEEALPEGFSVEYIPVLN